MGAQVRLLADPHGELARGLGLELDAKAMLGTNRSKRYSAVIQDNEIKSLNVEPDGTGARAPALSCNHSMLRPAGYRHRVAFGTNHPVRCTILLLSCAGTTCSLSNVIMDQLKA
jgi:hypothetical protein